MPNATIPTPAILVDDRGETPFLEAKIRFRGRQIKRRVGPGHVERDAAGQWVDKRGRAPEGCFTLKSAVVAGARLLEDAVADLEAGAIRQREREGQKAKFRDVVAAYMHNGETVRGWKRGTVIDLRQLLADPGERNRRGPGVKAGRVMAALGNKTAAKVTVADVERLLGQMEAEGLSARTINRVRTVLVGIYNFASKPATFGLTGNPAAETTRRRERSKETLIWHRPADIEAICRHLSDSDADFVRIAYYTGTRLSETLTLRWRDVDFAAQTLTVQRALSGGELTTTKSDRVRVIGLADQAAAAFDRVSRRDHYLSADDYVFCNELGRSIDGSALRRRFSSAQKAAGVRQLRWHDLRHSYACTLIAGGVDVPTVQQLLGHADIRTTQRYLHAQPATAVAKRITAAFAGDGSIGSPSFVA